MPLIYDTVTASNLAGYYNAANQTVNTTFGEKAFPVTKQLGLNLAFIKGAAGRPVVLRASAFDTKVTLRDRIAVTLTNERMPFFKEAMLVREEDRQQFNILAQTNNASLIDTLVQTIFSDQTSLVSGAKARLEAMRMQVLATGKISVVSNGQNLDYDYGVEESHKGTVKTAWTNAKATPLTDISAAMDALSEAGGKAEVLIMNSKTFALLKNAASTVTIIKPLAPTGAAVTKREMIDYLKDEYGLSVQVVEDTYRDDDGTVKKYFPDGTVTLAPNAAVGRTVFGTTPEESDLMSGVNNAEVSIVETGIAITTTKETDPVNVLTKVSMIALPSFEQLDNVYMLDIEP